MDDLIRRRAAIRFIRDKVSLSLFMKRSVDKADKACMELCDMLDRDLPSAQPERLTDDDFETIRIHLNAHKEKLCNQRRWEEAEEYQRIIDRFMAFASAQPEIIRCKECKHWDTSWQNDYAPNYHYCPLVDGTRRDDFYCADAERREDENGTD